MKKIKPLEIKIVDLTARDKKAKNEMARYCLPIEIGKMHEFGGSYVTHVDNKKVVKALNETRSN